MKTFRTVLPPWRAPFALTHADGLLLVGSCFTEHIGQKLRDGKFATGLNPHGIVYNPLSIARVLEFLLRENDPAANAERSETIFPENALFEHNGLWHSWEHHGDFSGAEPENVKTRIRAARREAAGFLKNNNCLLLTLGTAEVFSLCDSGQVVANCHKAPAEWFSQRRLSVAETTEALGAVFEKLRAQAPNLNIVLTVSPVRHLRNGAVENQRSKAVLTLACAELCERYGFVHYFPAYELLLDDLRDYRFYATDLTHPNDLAVDYIWQYFTEAFFPPDTRTFLQQLEKLSAAVRHRPFHPGTAAHRAFAQAQLEQIAKLSEAWPALDFSAEREHFQRFL